MNLWLKNSIIEQFEDKNETEVTSLVQLTMNLIDSLPSTKEVKEQAKELMSELSQFIYETPADFIMKLKAKSNELRIKADEADNVDFPSLLDKIVNRLDIQLEKQQAALNQELEKEQNRSVLKGKTKKALKEAEQKEAIITTP